MRSQRTQLRHPQIPDPQTVVINVCSSELLKFGVTWHIAIDNYHIGLNPVGMGLRLQQ